ncbi:hypothetical protein H9659_08010 [Sporosarcina sp. Sa3CUA8]|uniref:Uncharacterized protein n=2 Tax=Sporosarcina gallistercoris TaxID=2762245 RepID=A0ABR8PJE0_9BACL|nr:hypothetical protein [Sporosarcina gallistercoris]
MNLLLWIKVGFIIVGFFVLISMKKYMEKRVALAIEYKDIMEGKQISPYPVVWWIWGAVLWGVISIFLIAWSFSAYT